MLKILLKAAILVFIILSVYFIVNPSACSNLMLGRVVNSTDKEPVASEPIDAHRELFVPAGDRAPQPVPPPQQEPAVEPSAVQAVAPQPAEQTTAPVVIDTNTLTEQEKAQTPAYSQEDIDYAIASRYVELENEYVQKNKMNKDSAKEISYQVMDDFELTPQEWEAFLQRATQTNLFNQIRAELATQK